jgi:hypothetical protein
MRIHTLDLVFDNLLHPGHIEKNHSTDPRYLSKVPEFCESSVTLTQRRYREIQVPDGRPIRTIIEHDGTMYQTECNRRGEGIDKYERQRRQKNLRVLLWSNIVMSIENTYLFNFCRQNSVSVSPSREILPP